MNSWQAGQPGQSGQSWQSWQSESQMATFRLRWPLRYHSDGQWQPDVTPITTMRKVLRLPGCQLIPRARAKTKDL